MQYETQQYIEYGFKDFQGGYWCAAWVDTYNRLTDDINKSANIEIESGSLTHKEREFLLDQRHKNFVQFMELAKKPRIEEDSQYQPQYTDDVIY